MPKLKKISGKECIKILCKHFGFKVKRRKGSHVLLVKENNGKIGTVVPNHKELKTGTLIGVLELAKIKKQEFKKFL